MKTIMLVCAVGMSTSLLVSKMRRAAEERGIEVDIFAKSALQLESTIENKKIDILLLGPQVSSMKKKFEASVGETIPVAAIDMKDYGMMNGEKVLNQALELIKLKDNYI